MGPQTAVIAKLAWVALWVGVVRLGITGVAIYNLCFIYGLETVQASRGSLILSLNPAATMVGAALFLHEPLISGVWILNRPATAVALRVPRAS